MMGWTMLAAVAIAAALLLWITGFPKRLWTIGATGLMLGAAGYAWQGKPMLAGAPVSAENRTGQVDPAMIALREAIFGKYGTYNYSYAMAADSMVRIGRPDLAVTVWNGAVHKSPQDASLWTGLGLALAENDGNQVSPASKLAFDKALALAPQHPGPPFFLGMALIREGKFAEARPWWVKAVDLAPEKISYRDDLRVRLLLLDRYLAAQAVPEATPSPQSSPGP